MWEKTAAKIVWKIIKPHLEEKGKLSVLDVCRILDVDDYGWVRTVMLEIARAQKNVRFAFGSLELEE